MLANVAMVVIGSNPDPGAHAFAPRGQTFDLPLNFNDGATGASWNYWTSGFSTSWDGAANGLALRDACYHDVRGRWRASKGSAPVGRFTRAFGDNAAEGWHRSMPVGVEVTLTVDVAGNAAIVVSSGGNVIVEKFVSGDALASLSVSGLVAVIKEVAGSVNAAASTTGNVVIGGGVGGAASAAAATAGAINVPKPVSGTALLSAIASGAVVSPIFITGSALASLVGEGTVSQASIRGDALIPVTVLGAVAGGSVNNDAARINRGAQ